jgi:hypothetical protein
LTFTLGAKLIFKKDIKRKGIFIMELVISLALMGILMILLTISLHGLSKFNLYQLVRMRCISAAQAELDSIAVTGHPLPDEDFKRLWPKLNVTIEEAEGKGQWKNMKLVKVKTNGMSFDLPVKVQLSRYIKMQIYEIQQEQ